MWTCPNCAEQNDDDVPYCAVCATRVQPAESGARPPTRSYPRVAGPPYPPPADPWAQPVAPFAAQPPAPEPTTPDPQPSAPGDPVPPATEPPEFAPSGTPPLGTPPLGTPPLGTPPLGTPPLGPTPLGPTPLGPTPPGPPGRGYPGDPEAPRRPLPTRWALAVALVILVGASVAAAIVVPRLLSRDDTSAGAAATVPATDSRTADPTDTEDPTTIDSTDPAAGDPASEDPATEDPATGDPAAGDPATGDPTTTTAAPPASIGIVAIDPSVGGDDRAAAVATMFDTYFSGINDKNYEAVGSVLDPTGSVNPTDQKEMADLAKGTQSTSDSEVALIGLTGAGRLLTAEVTFQSTQEPGDGPRGRTGETCTRWDVRYTVSGAPGAYRIRKSKATSRPC
jgi:hypothetical protein